MWITGGDDERDCTPDARLRAGRRSLYNLCEPARLIDHSLHHERRATRSSPAGARLQLFRAISTDRRGQSVQAVSAFEDEATRPFTKPVGQGQRTARSARRSR